MKKTNYVPGFKVSADKVAKQLRQRYPRNPVTGEDNALKIATNLLKNLRSINAGDANPDIFPLDTIRKNERVWAQVKVLLEKSA